jgi:hypothetical protein
MGLIHDLKIGEIRAKGAKMYFNSKFTHSCLKVSVMVSLQEIIKQKIVLLVLEPEWEAKFVPHSYGFRK